MSPALVWLILILCLLISAIKYMLALILKWSVPGAKIRKDYAYLPAVSVLMPCYNEGKTVYETIESISKSNYPNDRFEVIAQDDCSADESHQWMLKAQRDFTNIRVRVGRNDENSGKARTVCNALQHSTGEIIISIDSDCIFHPDAIRELTACFSEPKIGSVGGRVGIRNPNASSITAIQTFVYYAAFQLYKIPENWARSVGCISGCLFAIRRELLLQIESKIRSRHWFGVPINQGEDRFLTHQTLLHGYGTYVNEPGKAGAPAPARSDPTGVGKTGRGHRDHCQDGGCSERDPAHALLPANHQDQTGRRPGGNATENCRTVHARFGEQAAEAVGRGETKRRSRGAKGLGQAESTE
jgi:cellulose synthase/poly-beta-1,6-N-acetylglucosamine synthase-like glycosyltransferase